MKITFYNISCIFFIFCLFYLFGSFIPPLWSDLYRYYSIVSFNSNISILDFIAQHTDFDFLYYIIFIEAGKLGISKEFVTMIYMILYYISILAILKSFLKIQEKNKNIRLKSLLLLYSGALSIDPILFTLGRNFAAISIFMLAVLNFLSGNKKISLLIFFSVLFFHIGVIFFYLLILLTFILYRLKIQLFCNLRIRKLLIMFLFICVPLISKTLYANISHLMDIIGLTSVSTRYSETYVENAEVSQLFDASFSLSSFIPLCCIFSLLIINLIYYKRRDFLLYLLFVTYISSLIFISCQYFLFQRILLFFPLLIGCSSINVYLDHLKETKFIQIYRICLILPFICYVSFIYSYRVLIF